MFTLPLFTKQIWLKLTLLSRKQLGMLSKEVYTPYSPNNISWLQFKTNLQTKKTLTQNLHFVPTVKLLTNFIKLWTLIGSKSNTEYKIHRDFQLMFMSHSSDKRTSSLLDARKFFSRWLNSYNFLFNLFYISSASQMFSNKLFIEESLIFNWKNKVTNYKLFKYIQPIFTFKDIPHGSHVRMTILEILKKKTDYTIIVDVNNHKKLLKNLKRYHLFMIGLVPSNYSPWLVSFAIPVLSDSLLIQLYFIKWLLVIQIQANLHKHHRLFELWR